MDVLASKGEPKYLAVIGDLRGSRQTADRARIQERLEAVMAAANRELSGDLAASLVVTVGDEFQGLLHRPESFLDLLATYDLAMHDVPARFALGWGGLSTKLKPTSIAMDGPCFHAAREAMERAKEEGRWITAAGFGDEPDRILNGLFHLIGSVRAQWTDTQAATVAQMRRTATQKEVAELRKVATSTVHKALRGALYAPLREAETSIALLLRRYGS
ncbi:MAG: hypothetical protein GF355_10930 [Candidatus Eisenbacteria bacterium]|nr:hypothetical protein [Candidatus Eisenbacteria bacterium]